MADMFAPLVAQLKANPKTIVFTEGNDPRILEAASKLLAEGVLKVVMVGNEAECKAAAAAGNFDISAAEISTRRTTPVLMRWSAPWWSCARASSPLRSAPHC